MSDPPSSIDIGTFIVAIGALVASTITFVLTYNRNRKSEQIKTARELMDRIDMKQRKVAEFRDKNPLSASCQQIHIRSELVEEYVEYLLELLSEIEYFVYLVRKHEIADVNLLIYYRKKVRRPIHFVTNIWEEIKPELSGYSTDEQRDLSEYVKSIQQSPWIRDRSIMWQILSSVDRTGAASIPVFDV